MTAQDQQPPGPRAFGPPPSQPPASRRSARRAALPPPPPPRHASCGRTGSQADAQAAGQVAATLARQIGAVDPPSSCLATRHRCERPLLPCAPALQAQRGAQRCSLVLQHALRAVPGQYQPAKDDGHRTAYHSGHHLRVQWEREWGNQECLDGRRAQQQLSEVAVMGPLRGCMPLPGPLRAAALSAPFRQTLWGLRARRSSPHTGRAQWRCR